jgi:uncharacterized protein YutE (UPF0331/DUF86 family)
LKGEESTSKQPGIIGPISGRSEPEKDQANTKRAPFIDFDQISALLTADKEMALIRVGITIEEVLHELLEQEGLDSGNKKAEVFGRSIAELADKQVITPQIYHALVQFREVRNKIVHWGKGYVPESAVTSAISSGLELLQALLVKIKTSD